MFPVVLGAIVLNQLQIQCKACSHKFYITRQMPGLEKWERLLHHTVKHLGLTGALTSFRVAGLAIGNYDSGWDKLFEPLMDTLRTFKNFLLITNGDTSILKGLSDKVTVLFQRCLWHIPHQFKWYLWKDGMKCVFRCIRHQIPVITGT